MRLVLNTPRRPDKTLRLLHSWTPGQFIVASSREQAERTYLAAKSLVNGRDPKAQSG